MKDFKDFLKMNESDSETSLLSNLYFFFVQKWGKEIAKSKFKAQAKFLQSQGEVSSRSVAAFLKDNNIDTSSPKPDYSDSYADNVPSSRSSSDDGCGSSYNAGCGSTPISRSSRSYSDNSCGSSSSNSGC